jgi:hypothetical protein
MSRKQQSLADLVKHRAAWHGIAPQTLLLWALGAIAGNELLATLPDRLSLDTKFNHGGLCLTWRKVITASLPRLQDAKPPTIDWSQSIMLDPVVFDRWLDPRLQAIRSPEPSSRLPVRRRRSDVEVRRVVKDYIDAERKESRPASTKRMFIHLKAELPGATRAQGIAAMRAFEGRKRRGRP